jgi:CheY-like chemotaxis protein
MSHEIRTPLNAILGFTEVLGNETIAEPERREHLETIRRNGEHLLSVINDVLDISKIEAGRMTVERVELLTVELFAQVISLMQVRADAKGLALDLEFETEIPRTIRTDPVRLRQILLNLIGNAVKFTDDGEVAVRLEVLERDEDRILLHAAVTDTGVGIPREKLENVFGAFEQADGSTTRRFGGTGLGLAVSARLVRMMGGRIWANSDPGLGSAFHFTARFRVPARHGLPGRADRSAAPQIWSGRKLRVLLAEDNRVNRRLAVHMLEKRGHDFLAVENGREAVEAHDRERFDAILMDVQMPELDGLRACAEIRRREEETGTSTPVIALTAHATSGDRERCLDAGMDDYVTKPIRPEDLFRALHRHAGRPARRGA